METFVTVVKMIAMIGSLLFFVVLPFGVWTFKKIKEIITSPPDKVPDKLLEIVKKLWDHVKAAEKMFTDGESKLAYVLGQVKMDCIAAGVNFVEDFWTEITNKIVDVTNNVNVAKLVRPVTTAK